MARTSIRHQRGQLSPLPENSRAAVGFRLPALRRTSLTPPGLFIHCKNPSRRGATAQPAACGNSGVFTFGSSLPRPRMRDMESGCDATARSSPKDPGVTLNLRLATLTAL